MTSVPLHKHKVSLDFIQYELGFAVAFDEDWELRFRIPYSIKRQKADIRLLSPVSEAERTAIFKNRQVHHRSATYQGVGDPMVLLASTYRSLFGQDDVLIIALGVSLPLGQTERDPYEAGDEGQEHLHIQFGTGSFDPLIEIQYETVLSGPLRFQLFASGRFPSYENRKGFRAPIEVSAVSSLAYDLSDISTIYGGYLFYVQGYGEWQRTGRDENTGLIFHNLIGGISFRLGDISVNVEMRFPLLQEALDSDGDAFTQQPSFLLATSYNF